MHSRLHYTREIRHTARHLQTRGKSGHCTQQHQLHRYVCQARLSDKATRHPYRNGYADTRHAQGIERYAQHEQRRTGAGAGIQHQVDSPAGKLCVRSYGYTAVAQQAAAQEGPQGTLEQVRHKPAALHRTIVGRRLHLRHGRTERFGT